MIDQCCTHKVQKLLLKNCVDGLVFEKDFYLCNATVDGWIKTQSYHFPTLITFRLRNAESLKHNLYVHFFLAKNSILNLTHYYYLEIWRQKQYFEQRKRKQQHHQTDVENYYDGNNTYSQQSKNNKSLDVLSLLNLSAVSKEPNSRCPQGNNEGICLSPNHQTISCPCTVQTNEATQMSPPRFEEESSSCFPVDTVCPKNLPVGAPESQKQKLKGNWNILNLSKMPAEHQLSVIDIISDDGPSSNFKESAGNEAHVAFSIQGLGKVDAETPVHSPERPGRNFLYGQYFPSKERKKAHSSFKNLTSRPDSLKHELDTMMRDIDMPLHRSPVEPSFCSRSTEDLFSSPTPNLFNKKISPVPDYNMFEDIFEDEFFGKERRKNIWKASPSFLPYGIIDQEEYGSPCKDKLDQIDSGPIHYADRNYEHQDFSFETHQWKKSMISPLEINDTDSPALFSKRRMAQYFEDPSVPNIKWNAGGLETFPVSSNIARERRSLYPTNHGFSKDIFDLGEVILGSDLYTEDSFAASPQPRSHFDKCRDFPAEHSHCCKHRPEEPSIRQPTRIIVLNPTSGSKVPALFQTSKSQCSPQNGYFDLQRDISEASNVSSSDKKLVDSSSYLEDQCSDTRKEPSCRTPDVTDSTNPSKPLEQAEETSSCAEVPVAVEEIHDTGDPSKAQSE
nr:hypothetical protein DM860_012495 [Ipomoea batatas]GMD20242.1 hypothetical protein DM860_012495 [Ipomoea batatas]